MSEQRADCWACTHSIGADAQTAQQMIDEGDYRDDGGEPRYGVSIVCLDRLRINSVPIDTPLRRCKFEREPGCGRGEGD